jgi:hypothetical protein
MDLPKLLLGVPASLYEKAEQVVVAAFSGQPVMRDTDGFISPALQKSFDFDEDEPAMELEESLTAGSPDSPRSSALLEDWFPEDANVEVWRGNPSDSWMIEMSLKENEIRTVSSEALATAARVKSTQLRKDLTYFGQFGLINSLPSDNDDNASKLYTKAEIAALFPIIKGGAFDKIKSDKIVFGQVENRIAADAGGGDPQNALQSVVRLDYNYSNKETVNHTKSEKRQPRRSK